MSDNRQNLAIPPPANSPQHSLNNYAETPQSQYGVNAYGANAYGANSSGGESPFAKLREWRRIIYRHKWLIISIILIALPLATIQAYRAKPIYQATTTIEVRQE